MTASRPARAMRGAAAMLTIVFACRVPAIEQRFRLAVLAGAERPMAVAQGRRLPVAARRPLPDGKVVVIAAPDRPPPPRALVAGSRRIGLTAFASRSAASPAGLRAAEFELTMNDTVALRPVALDPSPASGALAAAAYARLAAGDRRGAVRLFDAALAGDDVRAAAWERQRDALTRHWSASAYSIVRAGGDPTLAVRPVLGGGQSGGGIAFAPDPLSPRPFALTLRGSIAHDDGARSAFVAAGVQWHPVSGVTLAAERLIATGPTGPNAWTARIAAGSDRTYGRLRATAYGEGGIVGGAAYAAVQGRAAAVFHVANIEIDPGAGVWSSLQRDRGTTVDRIDTGPGVVARAGPFAAEVDYRVRVAGNAAPGSGPVLTLSAAF